MTEIKSSTLEERGIVDYSADKKKGGGATIKLANQLGETVDPTQRRRKSDRGFKKGSKTQGRHLLLQLRGKKAGDTGQSLDLYIIVQDRNKGMVGYK